MPVKKVISSLKSLVAKGGRKVFRPRRPEGVSESAARRLQEKAYAASRGKQGKPAFAPPYKAIVEQLDSGEEQILRAAVFHLAKIAANEPKYAKDIAAAITAAATLRAGSLPPALAEFIASRLEIVEKHI